MKSVQRIIMAFLCIPTIMCIKLDSFFDSILFLAMGGNEKETTIDYGINFKAWNVFKYSVQWLFLVFFIIRDGFIWGILTYYLIVIGLKILGDVTIKIMEILLDKLNDNK